MPSIGVAALIQKPIADHPHKYQMLIGQRGIACKRGKNCWAVPGGHLDPGERIRDAVIREVREETGLTVRIPTHKPFSVEGLLAVTDHNDPEIPEPFRVDHLTFWVRCFWMGGEFVVKEPQKCGWWNWLTLQEIVRRIGDAGDDPYREQYHWTPFPLWRNILPPYFGEF